MSNSESYPELSDLLKMVLEAGATGFWTARNEITFKKEKAWLKDISAAAKMLSLVWYGQVIIHSTS